uniref:Uncharacterized protein n=1 Tax=Cajanus cajan TaxID=3821 RepID=A0A151TJP0_CAJCA|nr:hypothetical protein KK1_013595 [Cajanus cajan]
MTKNEIKIIQVTIMMIIMLDLTQANYNSFAEVEPRNDPTSIPCIYTCCNDCAIFLCDPPKFKSCVANCLAQCNQMSIEAIDRNFGIYSLISLVFFKVL